MAPTLLTLAICGFARLCVWITGRLVLKEYYEAGTVHIQPDLAFLSVALVIATIVLARELLRLGRKWQ